MKNFLILPFLVLALTACGGKKTSSTSFVLNAGALISGSTPVGGIALVGKSATDSFSVGLTAANAANYSLDLPQGDWSFAAIAWLDDGAMGPMTGKVRCGVSTTSISGPDVTVNLSLNAAACAGPEFADPAYLDTATYTTPTAETTFKKLNFNSCLNPIGLTTEVCDGNTLAQTPGESVSLRLVFPGTSTFGADTPNLISACSSAASFNIGQLLTEVRWPVGGSIKFPGVLVGYEKLNCEDDDIRYPLPKGILGGEGLSHFVKDTNGTTTTITFADNYVGYIGSPFYDAHEVDGSLKLPLVSCGKSCFGTIATAPGDYSKARDTVRDSIWGLFGSFDGISPHDSFPSTPASEFINGDLGMGQIYFSAGQPGQQGNGIYVQLTNSGVGTNIGVICDGNTREVFITLQDAASKDPMDIASAVNSNPDCSPSLVTATVSNSNVPSAWTDSYISLSGGTDTLVLERREVGSLTRVANMLVGPLGAALSKAGITSTQICSTGFSGSTNIELPDESIVVAISPSTAPMPTGLIVSPETYSLVDFDKKLTLTINGVTEEAFYYNCDGLDIGVGAYTSIQTEPGRVNKETIFWNVESPSAERVEYVGKHYENGKTYWDHTLFEASGTSGNWKVWGMQGSDNGSHYQKFSSTKIGNALYTQVMATPVYSIDYTAFTTPNFEETWDIPSGNFVTNGMTAETSEPNLISNTLAGTAIDDLVNGGAGIFWDPTNY